VAEGEHGGARGSTREQRGSIREHKGSKRTKRSLAWEQRGTAKIINQSYFRILYIDISKY